MEKPEVHIMDAAFIPYGRKRLHGDDEPEHFRWVPGADPCKPVVITDTYIQRVDAINASSKIAFLLEPPGFRQSNYDYVLGNSDKFDYALSYVDYMKKALGKKFLYYHMGYTILTPEQYKSPANKTKNVSFILSPKEAATGHKLRHRILDRIKAENLPVDIFGLDGFTPKWDCLRDYRFSIVVMGEKYNSCVDEKLIDCCLAHTVPIFWGSPFLKEYFVLDAYCDDIDDIINETKVALDGKQIDARTLDSNYRTALRFVEQADEKGIWLNHKNILLGVEHAKSND